MEYISSYSGIYSPFSPLKTDINAKDTSATEKCITTSVKVENCILSGGNQSSITRNRNDQIELWANCDGHGSSNDPSLEDGVTNLICVNLSTKETRNLKLNKVTSLNRDWIYYSSTAFSDDSIFIPRFNVIDIFDIHSGDYLKTIEVGKIKTVICEENFLYALCLDTDSHDKLLQYDIKDLDSPPKQLELPGRVTGNRMYFGKEELLVVVDNKFEKEGYKLSAIQRENCFSDKKPEFVEYALPKDVDWSTFKLKLINEGFFMISKDPESPQQSILLQKLNITKHEITAIKIQTFFLYILDISDFCVSEGNLYTSKVFDFVASRYSIADGCFIDKFTPEKIYGNNMAPHFISPKFGIIQLISSTDNEGKNITALMTLEMRV